MSRLPKAPRWKRSIEAAYDFLIENEERTLPLDLHKSLKSRGYIVRTYSHIAEKSNVSLADVCEALGSKDGTAKYRDRRDKHIICYNDTIKPRGRIQWTLAHELGHIALGHLRDFPEGVYLYCRNIQCTRAAMLVYDCTVNFQVESGGILLHCHRFSA